MSNALARYEDMKVLLQISDDEFSAACDSMTMLSDQIGPLMSQVTAHVVNGDACSILFDDDVDRATTFKNQLTTFVLKATQAHFSEGYCDYVAGFPDRFTPKLPIQAVETVLAMVSEWLIDSLSAAFGEYHDDFHRSLKAWQKLMAVNFDLMLSSYEDA